MDPVEASWDDLVSRIVAGEVEDLERTISVAGITSDPLALERARVMLDRFWDLVHHDPARALGMARLTAAVVQARGASALVHAEALRRQATASFALGRGHDAAALLERALDLLAQATEAPAVEAATQRAALLGFLANCQLATGKLARALVALEEALAIARELDQRSALGVYLSSLGNARLTAGEARAAQGYYLEALAIAREASNREGEAVNVNNVALTLHALGELEQAAEHYEQALELAKSMGDPRVAATVEANLGLLHTDLGQLEEAHAHYASALELTRVLGDQATQATVLLRLARAKREAGSLQAAEELIEESGRLLTAVEDPRRSVLWDESGRVRLEQGDVQGAAALFQQALAAARTVGNRRAEALASFDLARAASLAGHLDEAVEQLEATVRLARELEDLDLEAEALQALGAAQARRGRPREAELALRSAAQHVERRPGSLLACAQPLAEAWLRLAAGDRPGAALLLEQGLRLARGRGYGGLAGRIEEQLRALERGET